MNRFRYRMYQFMQGRRGLDQFGRFLLFAAVILMLISMFFVRFTLVYDISYMIGLALFIYAYFRTFSRNIYKREQENNWFLMQKYKITKGKSFQQRRYEKRYYSYFKCPGCGQKMRAPRGKGVIRVRCHSCNTEFQKKV